MIIDLAHPHLLFLSSIAMICTSIASSYRIKELSVFHFNLWFIASEYITLYITRYVILACQMLCLNIQLVIAIVRNMLLEDSLQFSDPCNLCTWVEILVWGLLCVVLCLQFRCQHRVWPAEPLGRKNRSLGKFHKPVSNFFNTLWEKGIVTIKEY